MMTTRSASTYISTTAEQYKDYPLDPILIDYSIYTRLWVEEVIISPFQKVTFWDMVIGGKNK